MIHTVECSACSTSFPIDPGKVPDEGVHARCSACQAVFFVAKPRPAAGIDTAGGGSFAIEGVPVLEGEAPAPVEREHETFEVGTAQDAGETAPAAGGTAAQEGEGGFTIEREETLLDASAEPAGAASEPWVFETEPDVDPGSLSVERLDTVEEGLRRAKEEAAAAPAPPAPPAPTPVASPSAPAPAPGFTFGKRDPHEKASRLARVLVSDIVTYNPERHQRALDAGTLQQDFEDEIRKSWDEYVGQVGRELAESTRYFNDALNDILARGQPLF